MRTSVRSTVSAVAVSATVLAGLAAVAANSAGAAESQHTVVVQRAASGAIKGAYIVRLKAGTDARGLARALRVSPRFVYTAAVNGFAADLTDGQLRALRRNAGVEAISEDAYVTDALEDTQPNPPSWGIDRVDQRNLPLSASYTYTAQGTGVNAYVIDTGIDVTHPDFEGRAVFEVNYIDRKNTDCDGHGTHVAGTVGSQTYGIAKDVRLHAVKILNCNGGGRTSATIKGVDWVTANAVKPAVANTSWNWSADSTLEASLRAMISSGVFLATSAGNTGADSCDRLPRKIETALVTAASDKNDNRASYSSTGACVDIYAPGSEILSTQPNNTTAVYNGTSMATPHVTGTAALYLQGNPTATPAQVKSYIESAGTPNVINGGSTGGTVNLLLYTNGL